MGFCLTTELWSIAAFWSWFSACFFSLSTTSTSRNTRASLARYGQATLGAPVVATWEASELVAVKNISTNQSRGCIRPNFLNLSIRLGRGINSTLRGFFEPKIKNRAVKTTLCLSLCYVDYHKTESGFAVNITF